MVVRLGLIGAGRWGRNLIRTISAMDGVILSRVASRNAETMRLVGLETEVVGDWAAVAGASDLDGVIVASPPMLHVEMARHAVTNGLPVLIEKPLCLDPAEAAGFCALAETCSGLAMVEHTHLNSGAFEALLAQAASLGPPIRVMAEAGNWGPFRNDAPVLFDWGAHDIPMLLALFGGSPTGMEACCTHMRDMENAGEGASWVINLRFGAAEAQVMISNLLDRKQRLFRADFASAALVYDDMAQDKLKIHAYLHGPGSDLDEGVLVPVPTGLPLARSVERFVDAIKRGSDDGVSLDLGRRAIEILEACRVRSGR